MREKRERVYLFAVSAVIAVVGVDSCPWRYGEQHFSSALCPEQRAQPRLPADVSSWGSECLESRCLTASGAAAAAGRGPAAGPPGPLRAPPEAPRRSED